MLRPPPPAGGSPGRGDPAEAPQGAATPPGATASAPSGAAAHRAPLDAAAIARLVPHAGAMSLLDRALAWDAHAIRCESARHRDPAMPLRRDGLLPGICGAEFALQAMALHGALTAGAAQPVGFVSSLRDVTLHVPRLDDVAGALLIEATALAAEPGGFIYRFGVSAAGRPLLDGQAAVILSR